MFGNVKDAALVLVNVPFALIGGILAIHVTGINFGISAGCRLHCVVWYLRTERGDIDFRVQQKAQAEIVPGAIHRGKCPRKDTPRGNDSDDGCAGAVTRCIINRHRF